MTVYVDNLGPTTPTKRWPYRQSCHMTADTHDELIEMAKRLRLNRDWLQHPGGRLEHFDLTASKRREAVRLGAVQETRREAAHRILDR